MPAGRHPAAAPLAVVGESLVDIVRHRDGRSTTSPGGSPMNVAVGLARLGVPVVLFTQLGDDPHGELVAEHVRSSGAALSAASVRAGARTSTAVARIDADDAASYDFDLSWELAPEPLPDAAGLHVGSLGATLQPGRSTVVDMVREAAARPMFVSYDPNVRASLVDDPATAWQEVTELASMSTLVKVSDEDLAVLRPGEPVTGLAQELLGGARTELVVITRGRAGSTALTADATVSLAVPPGEVVDTVGAGDSFMAAALAVLWEWGILGRVPGGVASLGQSKLRGLLSAAGAAAAVTCSRPGADPPWRSEVSWLAERAPAP